MHGISKTLIAGTALLTLMAAPAFADDFPSSGTAEIINGQINLAPVWSQLDAVIESIDGDANAEATAIGNSVTIVTLSNTYVENEQTQYGNVGAELSLDATSVAGDLTVGATALCNGASISTDPQVTSVTSSQVCGARDPSASVQLTAVDITGGVGATALAVGNQIQVDSNAHNFPIESYQENQAGSFATLGADISSAASVDLSATAVGNTATFIKY